MSRMSTGSKKTQRERLRAILEIPYVKLTLIILVFLLIGLAIGYLLLSILAIYVLAISIGNQNAQLVVGMISALGTVASATVAYLLYRNSIRGAEITVALEDPVEVDTTWRIHKTPLPEADLIAGATRELFEKLLFQFEIVLTNTGPRSGAMTDIELKLMVPTSTIPTTNVRVDKISLAWEGQFVTRETYRPTPLRSGQINAVSLASNESVVVIVHVDLLLSDTDMGVRPP